MGGSSRRVEKSIFSVHIQSPTDGITPKISKKNAAYAQKVFETMTETVGDQTKPSISKTIKPLEHNPQKKVFELIGEGLKKLSTVKKDLQIALFTAAVARGLRTR